MDSHRLPASLPASQPARQPATVSASVIMTTFRSPDYLRQVLKGFANQTCRDFEIVVGEDGRTDETRGVIDEFATRTDFQVRYVSQTHQGFGKTRILNRAIDAAQGDYLIFTDGDCVPRRDFVAEHLRLAAPGRFLSGGCYRLKRALTDRILAGDVAYEDFTDPVWLKQNGDDVPAKWLWIQNRPGLAKVLDLATTTRPTFNGHNASAWKADVVAANGFNHEMRYGGLDRELGERLENAGVLGMQIRHRAVCYHLDHDRGYVNDKDWQRNRDIRQRVRKLGITRAPQGLDQIQAA